MPWPWQEGFRWPWQKEEEKPLGTNLLQGAGALASLGVGGEFLRHGLTMATPTNLAMATQMWADPLNHGRLAAALGDPALAKQMSDLAANSPRQFQKVLLQTSNLPAEAANKV